MIDEDPSLRMEWEAARDVGSQSFWFVSGCGSVGRNTGDVSLAGLLAKDTVVLRVWRRRGAKHGCWQRRCCVDHDTVGWAIRNS